jgi:hypothetical protein
MSKMPRHSKWFIKHNALPMCCESDGKEWPVATDAELAAWSVFCAQLETKQPILAPVDVPSSELTPQQLADAVEHICSRGWNVLVGKGKLTISRPEAQEAR